MNTKNLIKAVLFLLTITYFGCTTEEITNIYNNAEGLGKVNVYIEGNISNTEAQAKLEAEVGSLTENIYVRNTTQLTNIVITAKGSMQNISIKNTVNLTNAKINAAGSLYDIEINDNTSLSNLEVKGYNNSSANSISITNNAMLSNINVQKFQELNSFSLLYNGVAVDFNCRDLVDIKYTLSIFLRHDVDNSINFYDIKNLSLSSSAWNYWRGKFSVLSFPKLEKANNLLLFDFTSGGGLVIDELLLPKLIEVNALYFNFGLGINTFNLPALKKCGFFLLNCNTSEPKNPIINLPILNECYQFKILHTTYNSSQINSLLSKFLNVLPSSGKNIELAYQIPVSPPTGQGLIDKQTLINQGNTVITD
jgi:hypothetical protein